MIRYFAVKVKNKSNYLKFRSDFLIEARGDSVREVGWELRKTAPNSSPNEYILYQDDNGNLTEVSNSTDLLKFECEMLGKNYAAEVAAGNSVKKTNDTDGDDDDINDFSIIMHW